MEKKCFITRVKNDQRTLGYAYENALALEEYHPKVFQERRDMIQALPSYKDEKSAIKAAIELWETTQGNCQVWARIGKDEEYYFIQDYFIVTNDNRENQAAEYIGMAQIFTTS